MTELFPVFCGRDCGGNACPLLAEKENGRVTAIRHNPLAGEYLRGCAKGYALPHFHYSSERLKVPLIRTGERGSGQFRETSWDEALDLVAGKLSENLARHGASSIVNLSSSGSTGALHSTKALSARFLNCLGDHTILASNYSSAAGNHALSKAFGADFSRSGFDPATIQKSKFIVLLGANALEARLGAELPARLMQAAKNKIPLVSIDPRRTKTAESLGAEWIPIRPGTDLALLYAILYVWNSKGLIDTLALSTYSTGFVSILRHVLGFSDGIVKTASWAQKITGIPARTIEELADRWICFKPAMLIPGYSIQRSANGEETMRLCVALQLASSNFGIQGGSTGSFNSRLPSPSVQTIGTKGRGTNPCVPILRWPDAILKGRPEYQSDIHLVYSAGGNLLNQGADIMKSLQALKKVNFSVCHEMFMTPTARHCDVVLPAASPLQKEDIGIPWAGNYLLYKPQILPCEGQERTDYDIFCDLADRLGIGSAFSEGRSKSQWIDFFLAHSDVKDPARFRHDGIFFGEDQNRTGLADFAREPGLFPLATRSGKVHLEGTHVSFLTDCHDRSDEIAGRQLLLITPKLASRVHSQGGDHPDTVGLNCLAVNPETAKRLKLQDGELVLVESQSGTMRIRLSLDASLMEDVICVPEGSWLGVTDDSGEAAGCSSANMLTSTEGTRESTSCIMHGIPVSIKKLSAN
ncbi:MAG: molybdopterin-dependent oxidoreductase [Spirochaetaceae bacterium]|nr:molybdopterin-dependent oxidoreductase [Spirochaetaceae bacterium]